jgi:acetate---CoA ligase (ADP-forming)
MLDLNRLFEPRSIAIVGASDNAMRIGGRPLRILQQRKFTGQIYPVNPKYATVQGLKCFATVEDLPNDIDLYLICIPADAATDVFERVARHGAGAAVVFAGGFAETGADGRHLQDRLAAAAKAYDVALVGPNSLGYASIEPKTFGTFATMLETLPDLEGGTVAIVAQSGGTAFNLLTEAHWAGAKFSHVIATGNEAGLSFADYVEYLATDDKTEVIIGYLEGTVDGRRLGKAFGAARRAGKPVFVIKAGASERGGEAVATHTAQISGRDDAFDALFDRYDVLRLRTMDDAVDVACAAALSSQCDGVAIASNSGGAAAYLSDIAERVGIPLVDFSDSTIRSLKALLPAFAGVRNPLDFTPQVINEPTLLAQVLDVIDDDLSVDLLLLYLGGMEYLSDTLLPVVAAASDRLRVPMGLSWYGVGANVRARAAGSGLVAVGDPARLLHGLGLLRQGRQAIAAAANRTMESSSAKASTPPAPPPDLAFAPQPVGDGRSAVDEAQLMAVLERMALKVPHRKVATTAEAASEAADALGYPCVLKLVDPLLPHRAVVGAVKVGLANAESVRDAFDTMAREHGAKAVLVSEQVEAAGGVELIAGVMADPVFGTRAVLGSGGVDANDAEDALALVPPYDVESVERAIIRLRASTAIRRIGADVGAVAVELARLIDGLAALVAIGGGTHITEIECNPVLVRAKEVVLLDALAFVDTDHQDGERHSD